MGPDGCEEMEEALPDSGIGDPWITLSIQDNVGRGAVVTVLAREGYPCREVRTKIRPMEYLYEIEVWEKPEHVNL